MFYQINNQTGVELRYCIQYMNILPNNLHVWWLTASKGQIGRDVLYRIMFIHIFKKEVVGAGLIEEKELELKSVDIPFLFVLINETFQCLYWAP